ncbi:hypothetical protein [Nonomuraea sp. NPDC050310]
MTAALASAVVGGALLVTGGAANAATDPSVEIVDIAPNPVVVPKTGEIVVKITVETSPDVDKVEVSVKPKDAQARTLSARNITQDKWVFSVPFNAGDPAGKWLATAVGTDNETGKKDSDKATFALEVPKSKLDTRFKRFSADPGTVKKGKKIYFSGRLQAHDDAWGGVEDAEVEIYYRANGHSGWKYVTSTDTDENGKFYAKTKAYRSGTFKAVFDGDDELNGSASNYDYVRVVRWYHHR